MLVKMPPNTKHQVEDITIRFRTIRPVGLLLATTHKSGDTLEIGVFGGKIRLMIKINNREKVFSKFQLLTFNCDFEYKKYISRLISEKTCEKLKFFAYLQPPNVNPVERNRGA